MAAPFQRNPGQHQAFFFPRQNFVYVEEKECLSMHVVCIQIAEKGSVKDLIKNVIPRYHLFLFSIIVPFSHADSKMCIRLYCVGP